MRLPDLDVRDVVWHSRQENDWYAATVTIDCLAFLYIAVLYQVMPGQYHNHPCHKHS